MSIYTNRIQSLDLGLFDAISSQTTNDDRGSLLLLQRCIRDSGPYVYLEIGSHLGGSIQPYYIDPLCKLIYSIDKRPLVQPDQRGKYYEYPENSSARMMKNLKQAYSEINPGKVRIFDCDASEIEPSMITDKPAICFIDGEHTDLAVYSDFQFCLNVCHADGIIAFHDTQFIFRGIKKIKNQLTNKKIRFKGILLGGSVYAILLNKAIAAFSNCLKPFCQNEFKFFKKAQRYMFKTRLRNKFFSVLD